MSSDLETKIQNLQKEVEKSKKNEIFLQKEILREKNKNISKPFLLNVDTNTINNSLFTPKSKFLNPQQKISLNKLENKISEFNVKSPIFLTPLNKNNNKENLKKFIFQESKNLKDEYEILLNEKNKMEDDICRMKEGIIEILVEKEKIIEELKNKIELNEKLNDNEILIEKNIEIKRLIDENSNLKQKYCELYEESSLKIEEIHKKLIEEEKNSENIYLELKNSYNDDKLNSLVRQIEQMQENEIFLINEKNLLEKKINNYEKKIDFLQTEIKNKFNLNFIENETIVKETKNKEKSEKSNIKIKKTDEILLDNEEKQKLNEFQKEIFKLKELNFKLEKEKLIYIEKNEDLIEEKTQLDKIIKDLKQSYETLIYSSEQKIKEIQLISSSDLENLQKEIKILKKINETKPINMLNDIITSDINPNNLDYIFDNDLSQITSFQKEINRLSEHIIRSEIKWAEEINNLSEELRILEKIAVQAKLECAQISTDKEYYQMKYLNVLHCKKNENIVFDGIKKKNSFRETIRNWIGLKN